MGPQMSLKVDREAQMKVTGWEVLLATAVESARTRSFTWGTHDCATWAFDLCRDLTGGDDTAALWRGRYRTARGAARVMRRLGWASMSEAGTALLGTPLTDVRLAQRGDLVLSPDTTSEPPRVYRRAKLSENCPLWNRHQRREPRSRIHLSSANVRCDWRWNTAMSIRAKLRR